MAPQIIFSGQEARDAYIRLPWSKSLVNRLLLIHRVAGWSLSELEFCCDSNDSRELYMALQSGKDRICVGEGAAPYRFTLALMAALPRKVVLDAGGSMLHRDIAPLVDALNDGGADIRYLGEHGKPPVSIEQGLSGFQGLCITTEGSSQFASALMLVAPLFPGEKVIQTIGKSVSMPYLSMSAALMTQYGVRAILEIADGQIRIAEGRYQKPSTLRVETDWSAAAFFYTLMVIHPALRIHIAGLHQESLQGDSILPKLYQPLGVVTQWQEQGLTLLTSNVSAPPPQELDFSAYPDLLPAFLVACAVRKHRIRIHGIAHLALKESDRTQIMAENFRNMGVHFFPEHDYWMFDAGGFIMPEGLHIKTANDHRIAMAFALLAAIKPISIDDIFCVNKSFPGFWDELKKCNLNLENHSYGI